MRRDSPAWVQRERVGSARSRSFTPAMTDMTISFDVLAVNLSYVLHEPSRSPVVESAARSLLRSCRSAQRALARALHWSDDEMVIRVVVRDEPVLWEFQRSLQAGGALVLTIDLGATDLLGRVLGLFSPPHRSLRIVPIDHPTPSTERRTVTLFRAPAQLYLPAGLSDDAWFAILAFRPGWRSLLLDLTHFIGDEPVSSLTKVVERVVREHTDQWWCREPWWPAPAESTLSELREAR